jgi:hypothetical protein
MGGHLDYSRRHPKKKSQICHFLRKVLVLFHVIFFCGVGAKKTSADRNQEQKIKQKKKLEMLLILSLLIS